MKRIKMLIWYVISAFREAWDVEVATFFYLGDKYGVWKLRKSTERRGWPHITHKTANAIMWTAIAMQVGILAVGLYKCWLLYMFGRGAH